VDREPWREWQSGNGSDRRPGGGAALADGRAEAAVEVPASLATPHVAEQAHERKLGDWLIAGSYLTFVGVAELLIVAGDIRASLLIQVMLLLILIVHGTGAGDRRRALLWALALVPVMRIMGLSLPLAGLPVLYWHAIVGAPLLVAAIIAARALGYSPANLGMTPRLSPLSLASQLAMLPIGFALGVAGYLLLEPRPLTGGLTLEDVWLPALILTTAVLTEELVFRGVLQRAALRLLGPLGLVYVAALFATVQVGYRSEPPVAFAFAVGLLFGVLAHRTGSLLGVMLARASLTVSLLLVAPHLDLSIPAGLSLIAP
jgi:membrane protease YdiL (CAAX protease family)